jgi:hypothetical protein
MLDVRSSSAYAPGRMGYSNHRFGREAALCIRERRFCLNSPVEPGAVACALTGVAAIAIRRPYARAVLHVWRERFDIEAQDRQQPVEWFTALIGLFFIGAGIVWQVIYS